MIKRLGVFAYVQEYRYVEDPKLVPFNETLEFWSLACFCGKRPRPIVIELVW